MSTCRICARLRRWLGMETELDCDALWRSHLDQCEAWEQANSNQDELWWSESGRNRELIEQAWVLRNADPEAAFRMLLEAAEAGSAWAMQSVGSHYHTGTVVAADFDRAADYYRRAISAGSWRATIAYARLLAEQGHVEECEEILEDGVRQNFVPAYFWLARLRYDRSPSRATCHEIRPLLDYAAGQGHPGAKQTLGRLMVKGKFGFFAIGKGLKLLLETVPPVPSRAEQTAAGRLKGQALKAVAQE